jgi:outer membrane protein
LDKSMNLISYRAFSANVRVTLRRSVQVALVGASFLALAASGANAESLRAALAKAYNSNPALNQQRSSLRSADEGIPQARAGFLPSVNGTVSATAARRNGNGSQSTSIGIQIDQRLFNGFRTVNSIRSAEANVRAERANLANTELNTLRLAATAYLDVIRDQQIVKLQRDNINFLNEQVRAARARLEVGEGTRTDVAQADAQLAAARATVVSAQANLEISRASYLQVIGSPPANLKSVKIPAHLIPASLTEARRIAESRHPAIKAQQYLSDRQKFSVKIAEGALLPTVDLSAGVNRTASNAAGQTNDNALITATMSIPLFAGGRRYSEVRQAKENLATSRISVQNTRNEVRRNVDDAWARLQAARASVSANQAQIEAGRLALNGTIEEQRVGQRTTLDVLQSRQLLNNAQIGLAQARSAQTSAAFALAAATGRLTARAMGLGVSYYDERAHYEQVKDKWYGLRTPDGR